MIWRVDFTVNDGKRGLPSKVVAEAAMEFLGDAGPLAGLKLVGFAIRRSGDGSLYVTLPAKAWSAGDDRTYFDLIRSIDGDHIKTNKVKAAVLDAWRDYVRNTSKG